MGAVGLRATYFHLSSLRIVWFQKLNIFLISLWKVLLGSLGMNEKWLLRMNSCVLEICSSMYQINMVLPLSALSIVALFSCSVVLILLMVCISVCVLRVW